MDSLQDVAKLSPGTFAYFKRANMAAVDGVFAPSTFVQMTVSESHGITRSGLEAIGKLKIGKRSIKEIDLIFVVPRDTNLQLQRITNGDSILPVVRQWKLELHMA